VKRKGEGGKKTRPARPKVGVLRIRPAGKEGKRSLSCRQMAAREKAHLVPIQGEKKGRNVAARLAPLKRGGKFGSRPGNQRTSPYPWRCRGRKKIGVDRRPDKEEGKKGESTGGLRGNPSADRKRRKLSPNAHIQRGPGPGPTPTRCKKKKEEEGRRVLCRSRFGKSNVEKKKKGPSCPWEKRRGDLDVEKKNCRCYFTKTKRRKKKGGHPRE